MIAEEKELGESRVALDRAWTAFETSATMGLALGASMSERPEQLRHLEESIVLADKYKEAATRYQAAIRGYIAAKL